jgi:hypothetical protein
MTSRQQSIIAISTGIVAATFAALTVIVVVLLIVGEVTPAVSQLIWPAFAAVTAWFSWNAFSARRRGRE